jgi:hypothetical protein
MTGNNHTRAYAIWLWIGVIFVTIALVGCQKLEDDPYEPTTIDTAEYVPPAESVEPTPTPLPAGAILGETLQDGYTSGIINNATFTAHGLRLHGGDGFIRYSVPTLSQGYVEFSAAGFVSNELHGGSEFKAILLSMWSGDHGYDYAQSSFIFELRKFGYISGRPDATDCLAVRVKSNGSWQTGQFFVLSWNPNFRYKFRVEWSGGQVTVLRDGQVVATGSYVPDFSPSNHQIQIGAQPLGLKESPHDLLLSDVVIGRR